MHSRYEICNINQIRPNKWQQMLLISYMCIEPVYTLNSTSMSYNNNYQFIFPHILKSAILKCVAFFLLFINL